MKQMEEAKIEIGQHVKDKESPFAGKVIGRIDYLYGLSSLLVATGEIVDGKPVDWWIEEGRVEVLDM